MLEKVGHGEQQGDVAVRQAIRDLVALPQGRERHQHRTEAQRAEGQRQPLEAVGTEEANSHAFCHTGGEEPLGGDPARCAQRAARQPRGDAVGRRVGDRLPLRIDRGERVEKGAEGLHYLPVNTGVRFSLKARTASW